MANTTWSARWERVKNQMTLRDLALDVLGKMVFAFGLGVGLSPWVGGYGLELAIAGIVLSLTVKLKYRKQLLG